MTCQDFEELLGAYALNAATLEEQRAVEQHLTHCSHCTQLLRDLQGVVDLLPLALLMQEPSPALKGRILSSITAQPQQLPQRTSGSQGRPRVALSSRWHLLSSRLIFSVIVVLLVALLGGAIIWNLTLQQQVIQLSARAEHTRIYTLQGTALAPRVSGQLIYLADHHLTILVIYGLPPLVGHQIYEGWLIHGNELVSLGRLALNAHLATTNSNHTIDGYTTAAVSREPDAHLDNNIAQGPIIALGSLLSA